MSWLPGQRDGVVRYHAIDRSDPVDRGVSRVAHTTLAARPHAAPNGQPGPRIAVLADSAVSENVHRAAQQALAIAVDDLGLTAIRRSVAWFEIDDGTNAGTFSRHVQGHIDAPRATTELCATALPGRLRGFIFSKFGDHGTLWIRRSRDPIEAAGVVLHEAAHSFQVGQAVAALTIEQGEADAQAYAARMLGEVSAVARVGASYEQRRIAMGTWR